jgi:hypothetical protein
MINLQRLESVSLLAVVNYGQWGLRPNGGPKLVPNRAVAEGPPDAPQQRSPKDLPRKHLTPSFCWQRICEWEESGVLLDLWRAILETPEERAWPPLGRGAFADGGFAAKKTGLASEKPSEATIRNG